MTDEDPKTRPLGPRQEGSDAALAVLKVMADWRSPVTPLQLADVTGLPQRQVADALAGLHDRQRVVRHGNGNAVNYALAHRVKADVAAALR